MVAMDAHWKYSVNDAILLAQALEPFDLLWLEDPVPPENIEAQRIVTHSTRTPICTGENLYRKHGFRELIEKQAAPHHRPGHPEDGRSHGSQKGRRLGRHLLHPGRAAQRRQPDRHRRRAHVCAAMSNFLVIEFHAHDVEWWAALVDGAPPIVDGFIAMTDAPGHGLTLNEDVARAHLNPGTSFFLGRRRRVYSDRSHDPRNSAISWRRACRKSDYLPASSMILLAATLPR